MPIAFKSIADVARFAASNSFPLAAPAEGRSVSCSLVAAFDAEIARYSRKKIRLTPTLRRALYAMANRKKYAGQFDESKVKRAADGEFAKSNSDTSTTVDKPKSPDDNNYRQSGAVKPDEKPKATGDSKMASDTKNATKVKTSSSRFTPFAVGQLLANNDGGIVKVSTAGRMYQDDHGHYCQNYTTESVSEEVQSQEQERRRIAAEWKEYDLVSQMPAYDDFGEKRPTPVMPSSPRPGSEPVAQPNQPASKPQHAINPATVRSLAMDTMEMPRSERSAEDMQWVNEAVAYLDKNATPEKVANMSDEQIVAMLVKAGAK